jgi:hypothetical protein
VAVTGDADVVAAPSEEPDENWDDSDDESSAPIAAPWHNSTPMVLGASAIGIGVIAALVAAVMLVTPGSNKPTQPPLNFVEPSFSASQTSTPTTTATITSTVAVSTTDINPTPGPPSSPETSSSAPTSSGRPPRSSQDETDGPTTRTRRGPRTNVTRTLFPRPAG